MSSRRPSTSGLSANLQAPSLGRASWQFFNSLVPYVGLWVAMGYCASHAPWLVVPLALLAAGFLVRLFIIFHDCGHRSFLRSRTGNKVVGFIAGTLAFAPSAQWWSEHARHHASSGDLDRRGTGDISTWTLSEYAQASPWKRLCYRLERHPLVMFGLGPFFIFVIKQRFASNGANARERRSVRWTNVAIGCVALAIGSTIGFGTYAILQGLVLVFAGAGGVWLFYVQHQFEGAYWERRERWDYAKAALQGSSYYKLPRILQWFSGNIGFHHVHHLHPDVPNYHLERVHRASPLFSAIEPLTLRASLRSLRLRLWDEASGQLVGYPRG